MASKATLALNSALNLRLDCLVIGLGFREYYNNTWRWRKDDGSESSATWYDEEMKAIPMEDTSEVIRLRFRVDNFSGQDVPLFSGLNNSVDLQEASFVCLLLTV